MFHTKMGTTNDPGDIILKYPDTALMILYSRMKYKKTFQQPVVNGCWNVLIHDSRWILAIVITMHIKEIRLETIHCELTNLLRV